MVTRQCHFHFGPSDIPFLQQIMLQLRGQASQSPLKIGSVYQRETL